MLFKKGILSLVLMVLSSQVQAADEKDILGVWTTENSDSQVEISRCEAGLCGRIIALKEPHYPAGDEMAGQTKVDRHNPDASQHKAPLIGLQILTGFKFDGDDVWEDGQIYDPKSGKTYQCKITMVDKHNLKVRGFIGFALLGRTTEWTR